MRTSQISLLDKAIMKSLVGDREAPIIIQQLQSTGLSSKKIKALVYLVSGETEVRDKIFEDIYGQQYVGIKFVQDDLISQRKKYLPVHHTDQKLSDILKSETQPIQTKIAEIRRNYYAK